ncbi:MAG TPA: hypothetical protein VHY08_04345 [Bacillota bacterium]|nr:hypothetical protein [Bacillota bacterium]
MNNKPMITKEIKRLWFVKEIFLLIIISLVFLMNGCFQSPIYSISGFIGRDYDGQGIEGVTIYFDNGSTVAITDKDGKWTKKGLTDRVTVTPVKEGWSFYPASAQVHSNNSKVNFTATNGPAGTYGVSGTISSAGVPILGVTLTFSNGFEAVLTNAEGKWSKTGLSGRVTVTPTKEGWEFTPSQIDFYGASCFGSFDGAYTVSGKVVNAISNQGVPGVIIKASGY